MRRAEVSRPTSVDTMNEARAAIRDVVPELAALVRSIPYRDAAAVGTWGAADVAAHICHVFGVDTDALAGAAPPLTAVDTANVAGLTAAMLADDAERDPSALAKR